jgi:hypothetical protein
MKLSELTSTPKLVEIKIEDEETLKEFGEALSFHTWDRQPLDVFLRLANIDTKNTGELITIVKTLILDEKGKEIVNDKSMLPVNVLLKAIQKVTDILGK